MFYFIGFSSFALHSLKPIKGRRPARLPPEVPAQGPNSEPDSYDLGDQHYMELQSGGQRSSDGYDYAFHAYQVLRSRNSTGNGLSEDTSKVHYNSTDDRQSGSVRS